mmetsp:Transcript_3164/g.8949  ORF Transcript_3164/g.8949 Transcript_3164/m.8949 type:complete len:284 (-) Transcript_3164:2276-3127(-)
MPRFLDERQFESCRSRNPSRRRRHGQQEHHQPEYWYFEDSRTFVVRGGYDGTWWSLCWNCETHGSRTNHAKLACRPFRRPLQRKQPCWRMLTVEHLAVQIRAIRLPFAWNDAFAMGLFVALGHHLMDWQASAFHCAHRFAAAAAAAAVLRHPLHRPNRHLHPINIAGQHSNFPAPVVATVWARRCSIVACLREMHCLASCSHSCCQHAHFLAVAWMDLACNSDAAVAADGWKMLLVSRLRPTEMGRCFHWNLSPADLHYRAPHVRSVWRWPFPHLHCSVAPRL